jgi:GTP cyclohydrolase I
MTRRRPLTPSRKGRVSERRLRAAFAELTSALGVPPDPELARTPARAADLWANHLLAGEGVDLASTLGDAAPSRSTAPVSLFGLGVHLVCPHHLTVAFGRAHVAYVPGGRIVGFGALARLVDAATSRLTLQEDATVAVATTLVEALGASAAVAVIDAVHPCHNVLHARSHGAHAVTWASQGAPAAARRLERDLRRALADAARVSAADDRVAPRPAVRRRRR